jgi:hypothetical protein
VLDVDSDGFADVLYVTSASCAAPLRRAGRAGARAGAAPCGENTVEVFYSSRGGAGEGAALCSPPAQGWALGEPGAGGAGRRAVRVLEGSAALGGGSFLGPDDGVPGWGSPAPPPPSRTKWTRLVDPSVLTGRVSSLSRRWGAGAGASIAEAFGMDPRMARAGDFDMDGFTDVTVAVHDPDGGQRVAILRNVPGAPGAPGGAGGPRAFRRVECGEGEGCDLADLHALGGQRAGGGGGGGAFAGVLMGLDERGNADLLVLHSDRVGALRASLLASNFNAGQRLVLKAVGLNGVCSEWCGGAAPFPVPRPWGVNQHGVALHVSRRDLDGARRTQFAAQLSASSHAALHGAPCCAPP